MCASNQPEADESNPNNPSEATTVWDWMDACDAAGREYDRVKRFDDFEAGQLVGVPTTSELGHADGFVAGEVTDVREIGKEIQIETPDGNTIRGYYDRASPILELVTYDADGTRHYSTTRANGTYVSPEPETGEKWRVTAKATKDGHRVGKVVEVFADGRGEAREAARSELEADGFEAILLTSSSKLADSGRLLTDGGTDAPAVETSSEPQSDRDKAIYGALCETLGELNHTEPVKPSDAPDMEPELLEEMNADLEASELYPTDRFKFWPEGEYTPKYGAPSAFTADSWPECPPAPEFDIRGTSALQHEEEFIAALCEKLPDGIQLEKLDTFGFGFYG